MDDNTIMYSSDYRTAALKAEKVGWNNAQNGVLRYI